MYIKNIECFFNLGRYYLLVLIYAVPQGLELISHCILYIITLIKKFGKAFLFCLPFLVLIGSIFSLLSLHFRHSMSSTKSKERKKTVLKTCIISFLCLWTDKHSLDDLEGLITLEYSEKCIPVRILVIFGKRITFKNCP